MRYVKRIWLNTAWRRLIGSLKLQISLQKRATRYISILRKMTYKDKGSCESSPPCTWKSCHQYEWNWRIRHITRVSLHICESCHEYECRWWLQHSTCISLNTCESCHEYECRWHAAFMSWSWNEIPVTCHTDECGISHVFHWIHVSHVINMKAGYMPHS